MSGGRWFSRLKAGLSKSSSRLVDGIGGVFARRRLDVDAIKELEDLLITADLGPTTAARLAAGLTKRRIERDINANEVRGFLAEDILEILAPVAIELKIKPENHPHIVLFVGVNGTGKTTTIGKLAKQLVLDGKTVMLAAGDTFRAAAIEQLGVWGDRTGCTVIAGKTGTAGRLHNKTNLMTELQKIQRVIQKLDPNAPQDVVLVLDATTGQNAITQVETFKEMVSVTGLVVTKLDGTAKGGVLVALADRFALPVHAIGIGEGIDDLQPFSARDFARNLMGLNTEDPAA
jgi:fused signal recognition particle receptor